MQATYLAMERMSKDNGGKVCHAWTFLKIVIFLLLLLLLLLFILPCNE